MNKTKEIDYGIWGDISRDANCHLLGDCSGSTISRRTTKGFKNSLNLSTNNISDQNAEHIVHGFMIIAVFSLIGSSIHKSGKVLGLGLILLLLLFVWYQNEN
jgi:hypothetical protein